MRENLLLCKLRKFETYFTTMFFPPPREQFATRMRNDLYAQPPLPLTSSPVKTMPILDAIKKTPVTAADPRLRLPSSLLPAYAPKVYNTAYGPNNHFIPDLRMWSHIDPRLVRLNSALTAPSMPMTPTIASNGLVARAPYFSSTFPAFDLRLSAPNNYSRKLFRCPQCRYVTDRRNNLKRHVLTMHQTCQKMLECCGIMFNTKASLREHSMIFHFNGYTCHFCGRRFCRKALLKRHLSVHSGQKDYICTVCDYATSHKSNLERHRKVHVRQGGEDGEEESSTVNNASDGESGIPNTRESSPVDGGFSSDEDSDWEINVVSTQEDNKTKQSFGIVDPNCYESYNSNTNIVQSASHFRTPTFDNMNNTNNNKYNVSNTHTSGQAIMPQDLTVSFPSQQKNNKQANTFLHDFSKNTTSDIRYETPTGDSLSLPYNLLKIPHPPKRNYDTIEYNQLPFPINNDVPTYIDTPTTSYDAHQSQNRNSQNRTGASDKPNVCNSPDTSLSFNVSTIPSLFRQDKVHQNMQDEAVSKSAELL